ncbi:MAG TPA: hypothetical protein VH044_13145 [Polyangiaceae bacterium]|nr:hypothetical protein [Polyangiaceae bacterium]
MEVLGILFSLIFVTPLVAFAFVSIYWGRTRDRDRLATAWGAYARRRGLTFGAPVGDWPNRTKPTVQWTENGDAYRIEAHGGETTVSTRVIGRPSIAFMGELVVARRGNEGVGPGETQPLDHRLVVRAHPAELAERVLTNDVKRALLGFDPQTLFYRHGEVCLAWPGGEENDARLDEASAVVRRVLGALAATQ